ncbi:hypothetical protein HPP92_007504 [Vanilla planifolia]|uniref:Uncharacterized protein n=1 Tax=Vanilla planifolia TaxID=51239 RepID=A0A835V8S3_VANPL|nr:hypothetical protein HPP92_007504 [Vanilla planifolia]
MGPRTLPPLPRPSRSRPSSPTSEARSLVSLIRCSDHTTNDVLEEPKSRISLTFRNGGDAGKPPMAFADELFFNGFLVPQALRSSSCRRVYKFPERQSAQKSA